MKFELIRTKDGIRIGRVDTAHGVINTPFFMPVGTVGSVKGVSPDELKSQGAQIVLSNTYHLYLRPGEQLIKELGGLHEFIRWDRPILTDSGGYQVFSLGRKKDGKSLVKISEEGVEFTSHIDGSKHVFTPEKVIDIQLDLGVDILMPLDVCPSGKASREEIEEAVRLTIAWAKRSKLHFDKKIAKLLNCQIVGGRRGDKNCEQNCNSTIKQFNNNSALPALFGIVQGGLNPELRKYCAQELIDLDFDGYSIGGLAVDHETRDMWETVKLLGEILPQDKPRYLMGVGTPEDIQRAVRLGVDMFDCVLPTRLARHGSVYTKKRKITKKQDTPKGPLGPGATTKQITCSKLQTSNNEAMQQCNNDYDLINLLNSKYRTDGGVIEEGCDCPACIGGFSRAYISHLIRNNEILGLRLASMHNLRTYLRLMEELRSSL